MSQPATIRTDQHPAREKHAPEATAQILTQNLEDKHLAERVEQALYATSYGPLRTVCVSVNARVVLLEGRVPNYYLKQIAQETARSVPGAHLIRNDLEVVQSKGNDQQAYVMRRQPQAAHRDLHSDDGARP